MISHLLKLVWHRKRANALVMAEIFVSFLIVFAVVTLAVSLLSRWGAPLGFDWHDVWVVQIDPMLAQGEHSAMHTADSGIPKSEIDKATEQASLAGRIVRELETYPEVEAAASDAMAPYMDRNWTTVLHTNGRAVDVAADQASDDYARVMRLNMLRGRWFNREDEAQNYVALVVDADAARALFGSDDPIGKKMPARNFVPGGDDARELRVVGVIPPFRQNGELSDSNVKMVFMRTSFVHTFPPEPNTVVFRVKPGTPVAFESTINDRLRRAVGGTFHIRRMDELRRDSLKMRFVPVVVLSIVALFLISMVALGLTGVLWQTVTRRMREIGLRRAVGATGAGVRRQVLGEVALLSTLSVALGAIIIVQLPVLGLFRIVTPGEFSAGFAAALVVIYGITLLCGAYPGWLASTVEPAEALRYE